jgi:hypothetical protein
MCSPLLVTGALSHVGCADRAVAEIRHRGQIALLGVRGGLEPVPEESAVERLGDECLRAVDVACRDRRGLDLLPEHAVCSWMKCG